MCPLIRRMLRVPIIVGTRCTPRSRWDNGKGKAEPVVEASAVGVQKVGVVGGEQEPSASSRRRLLLMLEPDQQEVPGSVVSYRPFSPAPLFHGSFVVKAVDRRKTRGGKEVNCGRVLEFRRMGQF